MVTCFWIFVGLFGAYLIWEALQQLKYEHKREQQFDLMIKDNHEKRLTKQIIKREKHEAEQMKRLLKNNEMKGKYNG